MYDIINRLFTKDSYSIGVIMSFSRFYCDSNGNKFGGNTGEIDKLISDNNKQNDYYSQWCNRYKNAFLNISCDEYTYWPIRYYKSIWEMFSSATIFSEAKYCSNNNCHVSFYFGMYYSLFHAMQALLYLSPTFKLDDLFRMSHFKVMNNFNSVYCCKNQLFQDKEIISYFKLLKDKREYYSYNTPFNTINDDFNKIIEKTEYYITSIYQAIAFHLLIVSLTISNSKSEFNNIKYNQTFRTFFSNTNITKLESDKQKMKKQRNCIIAK